MIKFDNYTIPRSLSQASDVALLAKRNNAWLTAVRPEVVQRYRDTLTGMKSILRSVHNTNVQTYIVRKDRVAIGLATLVTGESVYHPEEDVTATGTGIDYWTESHIDDVEHWEITQRLLDRARSRSDSVFATLQAEEESAARGIAEIMHPIGHVAMLQATGVQYNAAVTASPLQLYTF